MTNHLSNHLKTGIFSQVSQTVFSSHIQSEYGELVAFVERLFSFLEETAGTASGAGRYLNTIRDNRDIDMVEEALLVELQKEIGDSFPRHFAADSRLFYKKIIDFYLARGTPESIKAFFRYLYNDNVDVYFPRNDILIPSDGRYFDTAEQIIRSPSSYVPLFTFTIAADGTTELSGMDDNGRTLIDIDTPLIFLIRDDTTTRRQLTLAERTIVLLPTYKIMLNDLVLNEDDVIEIHATGAFSTNDGFLSDSKRMQDSFYYQSFSYVLRTGTSGDIWRNIFNNLVHPAGFAFFSEILFSTEIDFNIPDMQPGFQMPAIRKFVESLNAAPLLLPRIDEGGIENSAFELTLMPVQSMGITVGASADDFNANKFLFKTKLHYFEDYTIGDADNLDHFSFESDIEQNPFTG